MRDKKTTRFIARSRKIHGNKYDYSKVVYINNKTKVIIICPIHGEFKQTPGSHLKGAGCNDCGIERTKLTTAIFIAKAREIHGYKYDYSKVIYVNAKTKVIIICPIHGEFKQMPNGHLLGRGCKKCGLITILLKTRSNTEEFILKARKIHGDKYDYSKVVYINNRTKVIIICPIHGEFKQLPNSHLTGYGCDRCGYDIMVDKLSYTTDIFIAKARAIHGDKYDYSKVVYVNSKTKVIIICPIHGEFKQLPYTHLSSGGCYDCGMLCGIDNRRSNTEEFIARSRKIHGDKYDYSKVIYIDAKTKVIIICPIHGEFKQTPDSHINGGQGCKTCSSSKGELKVLAYLVDHNIKHKQEYPMNYYDGLRMTKYRYDFYLPDLGILIEYDGEQHHRPVKYFGGDAGYAKTLVRDKNKTDLAAQHKLHLIRIPHTHLEDLDRYLTYKISHIYTYLYKGIYYTDFLSLCKLAKLPDKTTPKDVKKYLTYNKDIKYTAMPIAC